MGGSPTDGGTKNPTDKLRSMDMRVGLDLYDVVEDEVIVIRWCVETMLQALGTIFMIVRGWWSIHILLGFLLRSSVV